MIKPDRQTMILDEDTAGFVEQYVSVNIATRSVDNRPAVCRAFGVRVAQDRASITVFIAREGNQVILENIQSNHAIAVSFSRPSTHRTIQLKARDASLVPLVEDDFPFIERYRSSMIQELSQLGYPAAFTQSLIPALSEADIAIHFTPLDAYNQTPGPDAGKKIRV